MTGAISLRKLPVQGLSIFDRLTLLLKWSRILHILIIALQSQARFKCRQLIEFICIMNHCLLRSFPAKQRPLLLRSPLSRSLLCMAECYGFEAVQQEIRKIRKAVEQYSKGGVGLWICLDLLDPSLPWCRFGHLNGHASASKYLPDPGSWIDKLPPWVSKFRMIGVYQCLFLETKGMLRVLTFMWTHKPVLIHSHETSRILQVFLNFTVFPPGVRCAERGQMSRGCEGRGWPRLRFSELRH